MLPNLWEIPEATEINRLPMTSCLVPFPSRAAALRGDRNRSEFLLRLDGSWRFCLYKSPDAVPESALVDASEPEGFRDIEVPANWTLQDTGDLPIYTNVQMPFENRPPLPPDENPTGVYRTEIDMPASWHERRIVIHFGGVESYFELYVEGLFVGMAKDSRLPSEFDITRYLHPGRNRLAVKVLRFSDSSYVEDQDHWWMAGIYREVYLYSTADARIDDVFARADFDSTRRAGILDLDVTFAFALQSNLNYGGPGQGYAIHAQLYDGRAEKWRASAFIDPSFCANGYETKLHGEILGANSWSSEDPNLYQLLVTLTESGVAREADAGSAEEAAKVIESRSVRVGFRHIEVHDRQLLINGKAVLICGANRHEHHPLHGKRVDRELMIRDIALSQRGRVV